MYAKAIQLDFIYLFDEEATNGNGLYRKSDEHRDTY